MSTVAFSSLLCINLLLLLLTSFHISTYSVRCDEDDRRTLLKIKDSFGNPLPLDYWMPNTDCCSWKGIQCQMSSGKVLGLTISSVNLSGPIPSTISDLPMLAHLRLHNISGLTGEIPESLGRVDFAVVVLSRNQLTGNASVLFGESKRTTKIDLSRNELEFDMSTLQFPKDLVALDLSNNRIMGSIPAGIAELEKLESLDVSYNRLCGEIPSGGQMGRFDRLSYTHNDCLCGAPLPRCNGPEEI